MPLSKDYFRHEMMVHRYLYYVEAQPVVSDYEYDVIERKARELFPNDEAVQGVGSSLPFSYTQEVIKDALSRIN